MIEYTNLIHIAIDADSLVYKSCYRHQTELGVDIEQAYLDFGYEIGKIKSAVFRLLKYQSGDKVVPIIVLSPKKTFRHDLSSEYKEKRPEQEPIHGIKQLKLLIMHRLKNAEVHPNIEADDVVIWYAKMKKYLVAAIDKDVINACPTSCYNYNTRTWGHPHMPHEIEQWYVKQALMGDATDGIRGAEGIGKVNAAKWVNKYLGEPYSWSEFIDMFGDENLAILAMNLVRMDRLHMIDGKLVHVPWEPFRDSYWEF
jgi:5'-3' exonuclease